MFQLRSKVHLIHEVFGSRVNPTVQSAMQSTHGASLNIRKSNSFSMLSESVLQEKENIPPRSRKLTQKALEAKNQGKKKKGMASKSSSLSLPSC